MKKIGIAVISLLDCKWTFENILDGKHSLDFVVSIVSGLKKINTDFYFKEHYFCLEIYRTYYDRLAFSVVDNSIYALLKACVREFSDCEHVLFISSGWPLNNVNILSDLIDLHISQMAEYSFTENYPKGVGAEILDYHNLKKLKSIAEGNNEIFNFQSISRIINFDINQYDVEVLVSQIDFRAYRLELVCDYYRNYLLCCNFITLFVSSDFYSVFDIRKLIDENPAIIRTVPSYVELEITNDCNCSCYVCPRTTLMKRSVNFMNLDLCKDIIRRLKEFSFEYTLCIGLMGEPILHPNLIEVLAYALSLGDIVVILETNGIFLTKEFVDSILKIANSNLKIIIAIDSQDRVKYRNIRSVDLLEKVENNAFYLMQKRPKDTFIQFLRIKDTEFEIDSYYKRWSAFEQQIILQKYNSYKNQLQDLKISDLSPLNRHFACVHLKRDLVILADGNVAFCKQDINGDKAVGNIFTDGLEFCWNSLEEAFIDDFKNKIDPYCQGCDEWFTYNA